MNNQVRQDWASALRSGNYIQIDGSLNAGDNQYCALGVLCSLYIQQNPNRAMWVKEDGIYKFAETYGSTVARKHNVVELPEVVKHWAGLEKNNPIFLGPRQEEAVDIITANDDNGADFDEIADLVEFGAEQKQP